jgi:hypothetical protein
MSTAGTVDIPLECFSGRVTDIAPSDLPAGASPENRDVQYILGGWRTRPGMGAGVFPAIAGNPTINYQKTFIDQQLNKRFLYLDATGTLRQDFPYGTETNITGMPIPANSYGKSATAYGKEYLAFSDGQFGIADPTHWDGINNDRVSQVGPGAAPIAVDSSVAVPIAVSPTGAFQVAPMNVQVASEVSPGIVQVAVPSPSGLVVGDLIDVAGVGAGYNAVGATILFIVANYYGNDFLQYSTGASPATLGPGGTVTTYFAEIKTTVAISLTPGKNVTTAGVGVAAYDAVGAAVRTVIDSTHFTIALATNGNVASGGGTVTFAGHIPAGVHLVSVFFIRRSGQWTRYAPPSKWTAGGANGVALSSIAIGPPDVVARAIVFSAAGGGDLFLVPLNEPGTATSFIINDNVTTTATFDFNIAALAGGIDVTTLLGNLLELEASAGCVSYATRLFWWGGRNRVPNFLNMSFAGGVYPAIGAGAIPLGWTGGTNFYNAGTGAGGGIASGFYGQQWSYQITNGTDNTAGIKGMIQQAACLDYQNNAILLGLTAYSMRVKLAWGTFQPVGTFTVEFYSPTAGSIATASVALAGLPITGGAFAEFIVPFSASTPAMIPADTQLRAYITFGISAHATNLFVNALEIFPTLQPFLTCTMRGSYAGQPESYDALTGVLQPFFQDGGVIRTAFVLRENLVILKDDKWYVTTDDGANEPAAWKITQVSGAVGGCGINCASVGEDWVIVVNRNGPYIHQGAEPTKIGQEIQSDSSNSAKVCWNSINWAFGYTIWTLLDRTNKRLLIGAPVNGATTPNVIFYFDWRGMDNEAEIADHWSVKYSQYSGKILTIGNAPKWGLWNISSNSAALIEQADGTTHTFIGNGAAASLNGPSNTGKIYDLLDANKNDDGLGIPWSYSTYLTPSHTDEQTLQIKSHRKLFVYLAGSVKGSGAMSITLQPTGNITPNTTQNLQLVDPTVLNAITAISRVGGITTVTCAGGHGLTAGIDGQVNIVGAADASFNGTMPILAIPNPTQFTFSQYLLPDLILGAAGTAGRLWREFEYTTNTLGERVSYTFANAGNAAGSWAQMEKIIFSIVADPWAPVRGSTY